MAGRLSGRKVAIVVTDGFEQVELTEPRKALEDEGATTHTPKKDVVNGWKSTDWGDELAVDVPLESADAADYDALLLPGGVINPDKLRIIPKVRALVRDFFESGKPIAAICHGPWTLIDSGVVPGRRMTSWPSLQMDLENAGGDWVDEEVVVDDGLVTSRKPDDLPAFTARVIEEFAESIAGRGATRGRRPATREQG